MALTHITLRDFVIVHALELDMRSGFTVLTGETGAGKSILIDALQLVLGGRADAGMVREGAHRCDICAEFDTSASAQQWLHDAGYDSDNALLLRRTIDSSGKSRAFINGSPATAAQLRELGDLLLDIHGQHAWQSLTRPDAVRQLLDGYAQADPQPVRRAWQNWRQAQQNLSDAQHAQNTLASEHERLSWQIGEIDKLAPAENEWEELNTQHSRLTHAQALIDAAQQATATLEGEDSPGALTLLARANQALAALTHVEPEFQTLADVLAGAQAQAEDAAHSLHTYLRRAETDPEKLAQLDARLGQWLALARRYKRPAPELPSVWAQWKQELARLDAASDLHALEQAEQEAAHAFQAAAAQLSRQRQSAAPQLAQAVTAAMQSLGMQGGRFEVQLHPLPQAAQHGLEEVQFLVAAHPSSSPRPVGKVASGGELSRIALAIAVSTSELGQADTLIFDEVDSGVGGAVAETVGRLMKQLGRHRQVLAVTHLPQVAACADHHLVVSKHSSEGGIGSQVNATSGEDRVREIARMLGGEKLSATTLAHAREMLQDTQETQDTPNPPPPTQAARSGKTAPAPSNTHTRITQPKPLAG